MLVLFDHILYHLVDLVLLGNLIITFCAILADITLIIVIRVYHIMIFIKLYLMSSIVIKIALVFQRVGIVEMIVIVLHNHSRVHHRFGPVSAIILTFIRILLA